MSRHNHIKRDQTRATPARFNRAWNGLAAIRVAAPVALAVIGAAMTTTIPTHAVAQSQFDLKPKGESGLPMLLQADQMVYDNQNNRVIATAEEPA